MVLVHVFTLCDVFLTFNTLIYDFSFLFCHDIRRYENEGITLFTSYGPSLIIYDKSNTTCGMEIDKNKKKSKFFKKNKENNLSLRTAAFAFAIERVVEVVKLRGWG